MYFAGLHFKKKENRPGYYLNGISYCYKGLPLALCLDFVFSSRFNLKVCRYASIFEFPILYLYRWYVPGVDDFLLRRKYSSSWVPLVVVYHLELPVFLRFVLGCLCRPCESKCHFSVSCSSGS